jgi:hypothetical protein
MFCLLYEVVSCLRLKPGTLALEARKDSKYGRGLFQANGSSAGCLGSAEMIPGPGWLSSVQVLAELNDGNGPFPHADDFQIIGPASFLMLDSLPRAFLRH